jgi:hypothetical protein
MELEWEGFFFMCVLLRPQFQSDVTYMVHFYSKYVQNVDFVHDMLVWYPGYTHNVKSGLANCKTNYCWRHVNYQRER